VGVSGASIYRYFPNRDDILVEALIFHIKEIEELFLKEIQEGRASLENLALLSVDYLMRNNSVFQMMVLMITGQLKPNNLDQYNAMQRQFLDIMEEASHHVDIGVEKRLVTHAIYSSVIGAVMAFRNYPGRSPTEIRHHIYRLVRIISQVFTMQQIQPSLSDISASE
jgi:AcrR family transcriptional regulator